MGVNKSKGAVDVGEKKLYVNLLGEFSVWYGDKKVYMGRTSTGRQAQLFQLLMISPGFQISKEKLMAEPEQQCQQCDLSSEKNAHGCGGSR